MMLPELSCSKTHRQILTKSVLRRPVCSAADPGDAAGVLLGLGIHRVRGAAHLALAVHPRHRLHLVHRVLVAPQPTGRGEEEACGAAIRRSISTKGQGIRDERQNRYYGGRFNLLIILLLTFRERGRGFSAGLLHRFIVVRHHKTAIGVYSPVERDVSIGIL